MSNFKKDFIITNPQGLHARPAAQFVQITSKHSSNVSVAKGDEVVNGKSIMGLLTLGLQKGSTITITIDGDDAQAMLDELEAFLSKENLDE